MPRERGVALEAGFERGQRGHLFCVRVLPAAAAVRATVVFVAPFAEELNKSRHVVAHTARALAAAGVAVEVPDLLGCGDSEGSLADARVETWLEDLAARVDRARDRTGQPVHLWGLRLGGLLAAALRERIGDMSGRLVLWQPVTRGRQAITEFLRLRAAASLMAGDRHRETADGLRARLGDGETLEIAGYRLTPELAGDIDALALKDIAPGPAAVHWMDVARSADGTLSPAAAAIVERWTEQGTPVQVARITGPAFWSAGELEDCPQLAPATVSALTGDAT